MIQILLIALVILFAVMVTTAGLKLLKKIDEEHIDGE